MANISISLNLQMYKGFKFLAEKDSQGKKTYYAAVPVTELFNPAGTKKIYATAVMIPTPGSEYSDFMLKPMLPAKELQSMTQEQWRALPVLGTAKYMQQAVSRDLMKEAANSFVVDESDEDAIFFANQQEQTAAPEPVVPSMPSFNPATTPDTPVTTYYITEGNTILATCKTWPEASMMCAAQLSNTVLLTRYEGNAVLGMLNKDAVKSFMK